MNSVTGVAWSGSIAYIAIRSRSFLTRELSKLLTEKPNS